jgi:hypothetical protein
LPFFKKFAIIEPNPRINSLTFNDLPTSRERLSLNAFTHLYGAGRWVKGRVLSKVDKQGGGVGGALLSYVFSKSARNRKATEKPPKR